MAAIGLEPKYALMVSISAPGSRPD